MTKMARMGIMKNLKFSILQIKKISGQARLVLEGGQYICEILKRQGQNFFSYLHVLLPGLLRDYYFKEVNLKF